MQKIPGSLDFLEELMAKIAADPKDTAVVIAGADSGVALENVSRYQFGDTYKVLKLSASSHSPVSKLVKRLGISSYFINVGCCNRGSHPSIIEDYHCQRPGTKNIRFASAMSRDELKKILKDAHEFLASVPASVICLGEVGIGNTLVASAITSVLLSVPPDCVIGSGSGTKDLAAKRKVLHDVVDRHHREFPGEQDAASILMSIGSFEIAWNYGLILAGIATSKKFILDGFISSIAALLAYKENPRYVTQLYASHLSREPGHHYVMSELKLKPFLHLDLALGQGFGACLAYSFLIGTKEALNWKIV